MTEHQADRMIELLSEIINRMENLEERFDTLNTKIETFSGLSELADSFTHEGFFTDSFAERVGEKFNEGIAEKMENMGNELGSKLDTIAEKLDEMNTNIGNINSD